MILYFIIFNKFFILIVMKCLTIINASKFTEGGNHDRKLYDDQQSDKRIPILAMSNSIEYSREITMDSSPFSTFVITMLLIVYASFRSMHLVEDNDEVLLHEVKRDQSFFQTIDSLHAICLPIGTSLVLLLMFFFNFIQVVFMIGAIVMALSAFAYFILPISRYGLHKLAFTKKVSVVICGKCSAAELLSVAVSFVVVSAWILTGHWLLLNALSAGLCVSMLAILRLPSLKVSCLLLVGLLVYDVFWVFFSSHFFQSNVMVQVATAKSINPVRLLAQKFNWKPAMNFPSLTLPGKLIFPNGPEPEIGKSHFTMLGLGDIVVPGLLLCFALRYDNYKIMRNENNSSSQSFICRFCYFFCTLAGYFVGLLISVIVAHLFHIPQPALLYLVPCTVIPLVVTAYIKRDLKQMWNTPFKMLTQRIDV